MNDLIARIFASVGIPVMHQRATRSLSRSDGKRPDGLALTAWQAGKAVSWDITVESYVEVAAQDAPNTVARTES